MLVIDLSRGWGFQKRAVQGKDREDKGLFVRDISLV
jgi:hypothetical protein